MSTLDDIQALIHSLTKDEVARLREWFDEFEGDLWASEFDANVKEKKLDARSSEAKKNHDEGKSKEV